MIPQEELASILALGREPIREGEPTGSDLFDDVDFEFLRVEIQKQDAAEEVEVDWRRIAETGQTVLKEKSKNLIAASYLCLALLHEAGYPGLRAGLEMYVGFLETFWENLFPQRPRGRRGALDFLSERVGYAIARRTPEPDESEAVRSCQKLVRNLRDLCVEKAGPDGPQFGDLLKAIDQRVTALPAEAPPPPTAEAQTDRPTQPAAAPAAPAAVPRIESPAEALSAIVQIAGVLGQADRSNPLAYYLPRLACWTPINELPANDGGKTRIELSVIKQSRDALKQLVEGKQHENLLEAVESHFPTAPLWLDLQRYSYQSLAGLGEAYAPALGAVRETLGNLLRRLPKLAELQFRDGTPFADDQTRMWIETTVLVSSDAGEGKTAAADPGAGKLGEATGKARKLAADGKLEAAVELLQEGASQTPGRRGRFLWQLSMARLCLDTGRLQIAGPLLEALDDEVRGFNLEEWEPKLSLQLVTALYECRQKALADVKEPSSESVKTIESLYARLCRLDLRSALAANGKNKA